MLAALASSGCQDADDRVLMGSYAATDDAAAGRRVLEPAAAGSGRAADSGGDAGSRAEDPGCDLTGIWMADQITVSQALGRAQSSNQWMYLEFKQSGTAVEVTKHFDCGIEVHGSAIVTTSRATTQALIGHNVQNGRKGTLVRDGDNCELAVDRFWSVRGADESRFLPNPSRDSNDSLRTVDKRSPLPTTRNTDGAVDTENDGQLGVAYQVAGNLWGTRNTVQRYWTRWHTDADHQIPASDDWTDELVVRTEFDYEESVLSPKSGLLISNSSPKSSAKHVVKLRFLGRDASDTRAAAIAKDTDIETCYAIQDAMPALELE